MLTAISPESVLIWYSAFQPARDDIVQHIGEKTDDAEEIAEIISAACVGTSVRIFSSHESLRRDQHVAQRLRDRGIVVATQTFEAISCGTDKVHLKHVLANAGISMPPWGIEAPRPDDARGAVCKRRNSTQSEGLAWSDHVVEWTEEMYWEEFVDGTEFSVILFREGGRCAVLPVVWKGQTRRDLAPPWLRLRVCPAPIEDFDLLSELITISERVAEVINAWGFIEIEFVVNGAGIPLVLDVNPRISGTLRISAMAANAPVFDCNRFPNRSIHHYVAVRFAAEFPYTGAPFVSDAVIATSRITCVGDSVGQARHLLEQHSDLESCLNMNWPEPWK